MKVIAILLAVSLSLALVFLLAFYLALRKGQFEDLESPGMRMLDKKETQPINQQKHAKRNL